MLIRKLLFKQLKLASLKKAELLGSKGHYFSFECFADRHIGPSELEKQQMLDYLGFRVFFFYETIILFILFKTFLKITIKKIHDFF